MAESLKHGWIVNGHFGTDVPIDSMTTMSADGHSLSVNERNILRRAEALRGQMIHLMLRQHGREKSVLHALLALPGHRRMVNPLISFSAVESSSSIYGIKTGRLIETDVAAKGGLEVEAWSCRVEADLSTYVLESSKDGVVEFQDEYAPEFRDGPVVLTHHRRAMAHDWESSNSEDTYRIELDEVSGTITRIYPDYPARNGWPSANDAEAVWNLTCKILPALMAKHPPGHT